MEVYVPDNQSLQVPFELRLTEYMASSARSMTSLPFFPNSARAWSAVSKQKPRFSRARNEGREPLRWLYSLSSRTGIALLG
jgi:hypothetical protein